MKATTRRKLKKWMRKNKKYVFVGIGVLLIALIVFVGVTLYLKADRVGYALQPERFEKVQITLTKEAVTAETNEEGESTENTSEDITELIKDGSTYYENTNDVAYYQYEKNDECFLLYYDDLYGIYAENGEWVEVPVKQEDSPLCFDFTIFERLQKSDFQKVDDYYVLTKNIEEIFKDIMGIDDAGKFYGYDMKFYFAEGQLTSIVISYDYAIKMEVVQTYEFTYDDTGVDVP